MTTSEDIGLGQYAEPSLLILDSLIAGPKHGYALMTDIEARTGRALGPGTLYAALARLESRGLIRALEAEDRRRPYEVTGSGTRLLATQLRQLSHFSETGLRRLAEHSR